MQSQKKQRDEIKKTIYINRKVNYLNTYKGLKRERGYSWEEKTKILRYFFKKLTKFLINKDELTKGL